MTGQVRIGVAVLLAMMTSASADALKPAGGICECGAYTEVPVLCSTRTGSEREACIESNTQWTGQCQAWRQQMCRTSDSPGAAAQPSAVAMSPAPASSSLAKFVGSWSGSTVCPRLGKWRLSMSVKQQPDGSFVTKASTEGAGDFTEISLREDGVTLLYSSWFKDTIYNGRMVGPGRIEGSVHINIDECSWFLLR